MAGSPLRLSVWFRAIQLVVSQQNLDAGALAGALRIRRLPTIRGMLNKIRAALLASDCGRLLAGLDRAARQVAPETSVAFRRFSENEN